MTCLQKNNKNNKNGGEGFPTNTQVILIFDEN